MNRTMMPMMALAVFFCGVATGAPEDNPPIRSKQITLPQVEEKPMKIGKEFGGGIARMQMWRGVKSAEEIAKMAESAHAKVKPEAPKKK